MTDPSIEEQLLHTIIKKTLEYESPEINLIAKGRGPEGSFYRYVLIVDAGEESGLYVFQVDMVEKILILMRVVGEREWQEYPFSDSPDLPFPSMN